MRAVLFSRGGNLLKTSAGGYASSSSSLQNNIMRNDSDSHTEKKSRVWHRLSFSRILQYLSLVLYALQHNSLFLPLPNTENQVKGEAAAGGRLRPQAAEAERSKGARPGALRHLARDGHGYRGGGCNTAVVADSNLLDRACTAAAAATALATVVKASRLLSWSYPVEQVAHGTACLLLQCTVCRICRGREYARGVSSIVRLWVA